MPGLAHFLGKTFGSCSWHKGFPCSLPSLCACLPWVERQLKRQLRTKLPESAPLPWTQQEAAVRGQSSAPTACQSLPAWHSTAEHPCLLSWPWRSPARNCPSATLGAVDSSHQTVQRTAHLISRSPCPPSYKPQERWGPSWGRGFSPPSLRTVTQHHFS